MSAKYRKPSLEMFKCLENLRDKKPMFAHHEVGYKNGGGWSSTIQALERRGWIALRVLRETPLTYYHVVITPEGVAALEARDT